MTIRLVPFRQFDAPLTIAADLYAQTWDRSYEYALYTFEEYTQLPHYCGWIALNGTVPIGFALGTESQRGQWWHDVVAERVGMFHPSLQRAWVLAEIAVLSGWRNGGIGRLLLDTILGDQPLPNALLSTLSDNYAARRFYEREQWRVLHPGFAFVPGSDVFTIYARRVRDPRIVR